MFEMISNDIKLAFFYIFDKRDADPINGYWKYSGEGIAHLHLLARLTMSAVATLLSHTPLCPAE
jgi:hypothetical protein